jgi:hypothetical protein
VSDLEAGILEVESFLNSGSTPKADSRPALRWQVSKGNEMGKKAKAEPLILWGKHPAHGNVWIKLNDRGHVLKEREEKRREGWEVVALRKGDAPEGK